MIEKYRISRVLIISILFISIVIMSGCNQRSQIRQAVETQMKEYPESRLQDIYKSFFQDEFGPGHLIGDEAVAREYFDLELDDMVSKGRYNAEPCGTGKNFYRVPMDLVKDGKIPADVYFDAFLASAKSFKSPDLNAWKKQWGEIISVIDKMDLKIKDYSIHKQALDKWLDKGQTTLHHSDEYVKAYDPYYRIMSKEQWEKLKTALP